MFNYLYILSWSIFTSSEIQNSNDRNVWKVHTKKRQIAIYTNSQKKKKKKTKKQLFKGLQLVRWGLKSAQVCSQLQWNQICLYVGKSICRSLPSDRWWVGPAWLMVEEKRKAEEEKLLVEQWFIIHWEKCNVKKYRVLADIRALNQLKQFYLGELQPETTVHLCHHSVCQQHKMKWRFQ